MKITLNGWETGIRFVAGHFLPSIEKCNRLHGHNYALLLEIEGETEEDGIVIDFTKVKEAAGQIVKKLDHRMLLPSGGSSMTVRASASSFNVQFNGKEYLFPVADVVVLPVDNVSAEKLASYFADELLGSGIFGENIKSIRVGVAEGRGQEAWETRVLQ
jgi:6-pyruvoyltetrahydropterin/6-carboxytetrahydropterin synthase